MIQKEREREKEGGGRVRINWNVRLFSELYDKGRDAEFETFRSFRKDGTTKKNHWRFLGINFWNFCLACICFIDWIIKKIVILNIV